MAGLVDVFFLGGGDAEMATIRALLESHGKRFYDKQLAWGARLSDYSDELAGLKAGVRPVLVELKLDIALPAHALIVDHHGERAGEDQSTSLDQIAALLEVELNRGQRLIAANDRGHIPAMLALDASDEEITRIRAFDRRCQGVTEEAEAAAEEQARHFVSRGEFDVVRFPHPFVSPLADRLYGHYDNLLVVTTRDITFFGVGEVVKALSRRFPDGWYGGELPRRGFWGRNAHADSDVAETKNFIEACLANKAPD